MILFGLGSGLAQRPSTIFSRLEGARAEAVDSFRGMEKKMVREGCWWSWASSLPLPLWPSVRFRSSCLVNPRACHETELNYTPTTHPKRVAVVGAGPAGLSAATVLATRGHKVALFEVCPCGGLFVLGFVWLDAPLQMPPLSDTRQTCRRSCPWCAG